MSADVQILSDVILSTIQNFDGKVRSDNPCAGLQVVVIKLLRSETVEQRKGVERQHTSRRRD